MNSKFGDLSENELRSLYENPGSISQGDFEAVEIELGLRVMDRERKQAWARRFRFLRTIAALATVGLVVYFGYDSLDQRGMIAHEEDSEITASGSWIVGETKDCTSEPLDAKTAAILHRPEGYAFEGINCDDGSEHQIKIRFLGRRLQPESRLVFWRCSRGEGSFTCSETGAR